MAGRVRIIVLAGPAKGKASEEGEGGSKVKVIVLAGLPKARPRQEQ